MQDDREFALFSSDLHERARDYRLVDLPGYREWSQQKLAEGESEAFIAHLDATGYCLMPEEAERMNAADYEGPDSRKLSAEHRSPPGTADDIALFCAS